MNAMTNTPSAPDVQRHADTSKKWHAFDLTPMDDLSGDLSILKTLIDIAIDTPSPADTENLMHAALREVERADARHQAFHQSLLDLMRGKAA